MTTSRIPTTWRGPGSWVDRPAIWSSLDSHLFPFNEFEYYANTSLFSPLSSPFFFFAKIFLLRLAVAAGDL